MSIQNRVCQAFCGAPQGNRILISGEVMDPHQNRKISRINQEEDCRFAYLWRPGCAAIDRDESTGSHGLNLFDFKNPTTTTSGQVLVGYAYSVYSWKDSK